MTEKKYRWIASSNDGAFQDESKQLFNSKEDCYNDMRNNALEKMKWNTEFKHDYFDCESIPPYGVIFSKDKIIHESYSGVYTYSIEEVHEQKAIQLTDEHLSMIIHALATTIRVNKESFENMREICGVTQESKEIEESMNCGILKMKKLMADLHFSKTIYND